jgi:cold shock CspA family protein
MLALRRNNPAATARLESSVTSNSQAAVADSPQETDLKPIITTPGRLSGIDADGIVTEAQRSASEILDCLATEDTDTCIRSYATDATSVRDKLHNDGIEFKRLNETVAVLENKPTVAALRSSAQLLRDVADEVSVLAHPNPSKTKGAEKPVFVRHEVGTAVGWFNDQGIIRTDSGQEIDVFESGVSEPGHSLAEGERVEFDVMRGPFGVTAVNVRVLPLSSGTNAQVGMQTKDSAVGSSRTRDNVSAEPAVRSTPDVQKGSQGAVPRSEAGTAGTDTRREPSPTAQITAQGNGFVFSVQRCSLRRGMLFCAGSVVNRMQRRSLDLNAQTEGVSSMIDNNGMQYKLGPPEPNTIAFGSTDRRQDLETDIPLSFTLTLQHLSSDATSVNLLLACWTSQPYGFFNVTLRNIPVSQE